MSCLRISTGGLSTAYGLDNVRDDIDDLCSLPSLADILAAAIRLVGALGDHIVIIRNAQGDLVISDSARANDCTMGFNDIENRCSLAGNLAKCDVIHILPALDVVFSMMGLFGVTLDPHRYRVNDRLLATRAFAQVSLEIGRSANWSGISSFLPLSRQLPALPEAPNTSLIDGIVRI